METITLQQKLIDNDDDVDEDDEEEDQCLD